MEYRRGEAGVDGRDAAEQLRDQELKSCVEQMQKKHQQLFESFYNLL